MPAESHRLDLIDPELLAALARASTPAERLGSAWLALTAADSDTDGEATPPAEFDAWLRAVVDGDAERADRLLGDRGFSLAKWRCGWSDVRPVAGAPTPDWVGIVGDMFALIADRPAAAREIRAPMLIEVAGPGLPEWVDGRQPWRFHPGFAAWLAHARGAVATWCAQSRAPLSDEAGEELALGLMRRLLMVAGPTLMNEPGVETAFADDPAATWRRLFIRLPVLARLLATAWRQWHEVTAELLGRIGGDLPELEPGRHPLVGRIELGAGDQHRDGRGVAALTLADGTRWFYKPRPQGPEAIVSACFAALDARARDADGSGTGDHDATDERFDLTLPRYVEREGYCWVAEVAETACAGESDVRAWFRRAGASLRVLQLLGATDLHHENFIATRTQPVLVDVETAIGPGSGWAAAAGRPGATGAPTPAADLADPAVVDVVDVVDVVARLADTPTATAMVTSPTDGPPGTVSLDLGALAGPVVRLTPYEVSELVATDEGPQLQRRRVPMANGSALPMLDGERVAVGPYEVEVRAGYREAARRLRDAVGVEALDALVIADAGRSQLRFVARATQVYMRVLQQSVAGSALTDGRLRELVLERLWRAFGTCPSALIASEERALRDLDVPVFTVALDSTDLHPDRGAAIPQALAAAPLAEVRRRLARLHDHSRPGTAPRPNRDVLDDDDDDLAAALFAAAPQAVPAGHASSQMRATTSRLDLPTVAEELLGQLGRDRRGRPVWLGLAYDPSRHRWRHQRLDPGLLGDAGVGLALVAFGQLHPEAPPNCTDLGVRTLLTAADRVSELRPGWSGADAFTGPSGLLYALARAGTLLDAEDRAELLAAADELWPAVRAAAELPVAGPVLDARAGGALAAWTMNTATGRHADWVTTATDWLDGPPPATRDDEIDDRWWPSMPSQVAGHALARHRLGLPATGAEGGPAVAEAATTATPSADDAVRAYLGDPDPDRWEGLFADCDGGLAATSLAWWACAAWRRTGEDAWLRRCERAQTYLAALHDDRGSWLPEALGVDRRRLSGVHGLAGVMMLGVALHPDAPDLRLFA